MKRFFQRLRAWYQRRFHGYVAAPQIAGSRGTAWQEHTSRDVIPQFGQGFWTYCRCGRRVDFTPSDYFVREQDPETHNVTSARYCRVCPCGLGHWMIATNHESRVTEPPNA